ncbi:hypothetical protein [Sporosarcina sp. FSL K6-3457]|uniref:hypothetical protein n=1 Tax=Sporosarcina sp. FSL K6-3457 TaxID=2978204 RepID=UPI0030F82317
MENQIFNQKFGIEQLVAASEAARNFSGLRKSAKLAPRLILENNKPDSVILSIVDYQFMQELISTLQDEILELKTIARIENAKVNGIKKQKFDDFATEEDKEIAKAVTNWDISDDELFD